MKQSDATPEKARALRQGLKDLEDGRKPPPEPEPGWPPTSSVAERLKAQAWADAGRLGHDQLTMWLAYGDAWLSRCVRCQLGVTVSPRAWGAARINGGAVALRCRR